MPCPYLERVRGAQNRGQHQRATNLLSLLLHTTTMLLAMAIIAVIVYRHVGLAILRKAWLSFDALWAGVFIFSGAFLLI